MREKGDAIQRDAYPVSTDRGGVAHRVPYGANSTLRVGVLSSTRPSRLNRVYCYLELEPRSQKRKKVVRRKTNCAGGRVLHDSNI